MPFDRRAGHRVRRRADAVHLHDLLPRPDVAGELLRRLRRGGSTNLVVTPAQHRVVNPGDTTAIRRLYSASTCGCSTPTPGRQAAASASAAPTLRRPAPRERLHRRSFAAHVRGQRRVGRRQRPVGVDHVHLRQAPAARAGGRSTWSAIPPIPTCGPASLGLPVERDRGRPAVHRPDRQRRRPRGRRRQCRCVLLPRRRPLRSGRAVRAPVCVDRLVRASTAATSPSPRPSPATRLRSRARPSCSGRVSIETAVTGANGKAAVSRSCSRPPRAPSSSRRRSPATPSTSRARPPPPSPSTSSRRPSSLRTRRDRVRWRERHLGDARGQRVAAGLPDLTFVLTGTGRTPRGFGYTKSVSTDTTGVGALGTIPTSLPAGPYTVSVYFSGTIELSPWNSSMVPEK